MNELLSEGHKLSDRPKRSEEKRIQIQLEQANTKKPGPQFLFPIIPIGSINARRT